MSGLATLTLARIYAQQGFYDQAMEVYRKLLSEDPENGSIRSEIEAISKKYPGHDANADVRVRMVAINREIRLLESWLRRLGNERNRHGL